ncbi:hypothetical protein ACFVDI_02485 [Nocardioides sp. NPDC057767]|uniref:hypothetical protein n=1 Tax=unclassified Nocardioides TaxID=2615069 RepID=UPI00366CA117
MPDNRDQALRHALEANLAVVRAAASGATPDPGVGEVWRVRWDDAAGAVMIIAVDSSTEVSGPAKSVRAAPVSFGDEPDDSAVLAPAAAHDLGFDLAVWVNDAADVPVRVLEAKLGQCTIAETGAFPRGTRNWGPTDPRSRHRARLQDLMDRLAGASWVPVRAGATSLASMLANADIRDVAEALGSIPAAMQLRRGQGWLTPDQAHKLAPILSVAPETLLAASSPLPAELITAMDQPRVRALVDRVAQQRKQDELTAWRSAAYGVYALAAREHTRATATSWAGRASAYFDAILDTHDRGSTQ